VVPPVFRLWPNPPCRTRPDLSRIRYHSTGNADRSTLRLTLGCILGLELRRVGSGQRFTFADAETRLTEWMAENTRVCWTVCRAPWTVEAEAIAKLCLPLNLDQNDRHPFHPVLTAMRAEAGELSVWTKAPRADV
jgi:hypothetical protein